MIHVKKFVFSKFAAIQPAALLFPLVADFFQTFSWLLRENDIWEAIQKQPSRGVLIKKCSENMQQIYRRTNVPKCDFNKNSFIGIFRSFWSHSENSCWRTPLASCFFIWRQAGGFFSMAKLYDKIGAIKRK